MTPTGTLVEGARPDRGSKLLAPTGRITDRQPTVSVPVIDGCRLQWNS